MEDMPSELEILYMRHSTRRFSDKPVPVSFIRRIVNAGTYAPTPCNQQLWSFVVINDPLIKKQLVARASSSTSILRTPVVIVVLYDGWNYKEAIQAASMAVQNMLLASTAYGIGALVINSFGSPRRIREVLKIPNTQEICCFVLLGYPEASSTLAPPVRRRPVEEVIHYNAFDERRSPARISYDPENWISSMLAQYQKYYCRKTTLGKKMDITAPIERRIVQDELSDFKGKALDLLSYDGSYLQLYPKAVEIDCIDLTLETSMYTKAALERNESSNYGNLYVYDPDAATLGNDRYSFLSMIYKAERVPRNLLRRLLSQGYMSLREDGELIIIARSNNPLLSIFHNMLRAAFGDDTRKTGMYSFFGPYKPVDIARITEDIKVSGFREPIVKRYCLLPPIFETFLQFFFQYMRSGGTTFLHRQRRENILTRMFEYLVNVQGIRRSHFGSIAVIRAAKL